MSYLRSFITKLFVITMAVVAMQLPFFVDQYLMHLEGHLEESRLVIADVKVKALDAGFDNLENYIHIFRQDPRKAIANQGLFLQQLVTRNTQLENAFKRLQESNSLTRPFVLIVHYDAAIARETFGSFAPGVMVTKAALLWACMGFLIALLTLQIPLFRSRSPGR